MVKSKIGLLNVKECVRGNLGPGVSDQRVQRQRNERVDNERLVMCRDRLKDLV